MSPMLVIAKNSFREYIRDRVVLICGFVALVLLALSILLGALSFAEQQRILAHLGLTAIHLSGLGIVCFIGAFALHKEMERQTCLLVLARPVSRVQFLIGKWLGVFALMIVMWAILSLILALLLKFSFPAVNYVVVIYGLLVELTLLLALSFFGSTFLRPIIALLFTFGVYLIGNWIEEFSYFGKKIQDSAYVLMSDILEKIAPNLYEMNWRSVYFLENGVPGSKVLWITVHGLGWTLLFLVLAVFVFRRKDIV